MLDDGSELTIIEKDIADKLGLHGPTEPFQLRTANGVSSEDSHRVSVTIQGTSMEQAFKMDNMRTIKNLPLHYQAVNISKLQQHWKHLQGVDLPSLQNAKPTVLIGQDNAELIVARQCITGPWKSPILSNTSLGWVVHGTIAGQRGKIKNGPLECLRIQNNMDNELHQMVKDSFSNESFGVKVMNDTPLSREDKHA